MSRITFTRTKRHGTQKLYRTTYRFTRHERPDGTIYHRLVNARTLLDYPYKTPTGVVYDNPATIPRVIKDWVSRLIEASNEN